MKVSFSILILLTFVKFLAPLAYAESNRADDCSAVTTGNNNNVNIVCGDVIIPPDFSREDFLAELRRREAEIREEEREFRKLLR